MDRPTGVQQSGPYSEQTILAEICHAASTGDERAASCLGYKRHLFLVPPEVQRPLPVTLYVPLFFPTEHPVNREFLRWRAEDNPLSLIYVIGTQENYLGFRIWRHFDEFLQLSQDEEIQLGIVDDTAYCIKNSVNDLRREFGLDKMDTKISIQLTGYSQGGSIAAAVTVVLFGWTQEINADISCTTFDAPGIHDCHLNLSMVGRQSWEKRMTNFVSDPNGINMINQHCGKIVHLKTEINRQTDWKWAIGCFLLDALRMIIIYVLVRYSYAEWIVPLFLARTAKSSRIKKLLAPLIPLVFVALTTSSPSQTTSASTIHSALRRILGKPTEEILESHSLRLMIYGLRTCRYMRNYAEVDSWPDLKCLSLSTMEVAVSWISSLVPFWKTNRGVRYWNNRQEFIQARISTMKGYQIKSREN